MKNIVIYHSKYGHTRQYAEWIGEALGCPVKSMTEVKDDALSNFDQIIYGAPIYAGRFKGKDFLAEHGDKVLHIFTVGLSDPNDTNYEENIDASVSAEVKEKAHFYHFRGGMNYRKLSLGHKLLMSMMKKMTFEKVPVAERDQNFETMLQNYYQSFDFSDKQSIQPLIENVQRLQ